MTGSGWRGLYKAGGVAALLAVIVVAAGLADMMHGVFEMWQGRVRPDGAFIYSLGLPCDPETAWNGCEPAFTIVPDFFITGLLALVIGLLIVVWSVAFVQRRHGGLVLILLSAALFLFGGGFFPPLIGIVGGAAGTQINRPPPSRPGETWRFLALLWPWPLLIFLGWTFGQIAVGYFFNDFLQGVMVYGIFLILITMLLSVATAHVADVTS
jgi:hypothetical protein